MGNWLYFKTTPEFKDGYLPENRELVGLYIGHPEEERCHIWRYPETTDIPFDLLTVSYTTYEACKTGFPYKGGK